MKAKERIRRPISDGELKRRWSLVKNLLKERNLDCLIVQNTNMHLGGYVRWLTDIPAEYNLPMTVIFPVDEEMTLIRSRLAPMYAYPPLWAVRGVKQILTERYSPSLYYTGETEVGLTIDYLRKRNFRGMGYAGRAFFSAEFMTKMKAAFPKTEFVGLTEEIDLMKAIKSEEEMELVRETCRIHDLIWAALPAIIKPGMYEYQIRSEVQQLAINLGSEEQLIFLGTAQPGLPCGMNMFNFANRRVQEGDYGTLLLEVSGPGGYYCESARNFCFGEPNKEHAEAWEVAVKAQKLTQDLLTPSRDSREIVREYNKYVSALGYCEEGRLYGHSQGYDLIERPAFMADSEDGVETMRIQAGMNCSLHPYFTSETLTVYINDNYYVTEHGAEKIHQTPPEIILL
ncbi:MAG: M24 family metallopeptidase [Desulfitobacteriia bacterium]|jgi:Xaa-Pro aminopeptidase